MQTLFLYLNNVSTLHCETLKSRKVVLSENYSAKNYEVDIFTYLQ